MGIHHIVHDLHPPFQCDHLKDKQEKWEGSARVHSSVYNKQTLAGQLQPKKGEKQQFISVKPNFHFGKSAWYCLVTLAYYQSL